MKIGWSISFYQLSNESSSRAYDEEEISPSTLGLITLHGHSLSPLLYDEEDRAYQIITNNYMTIDFPFLEGLTYQLNTGLRARNTDYAQYRGRNTYDGNLNNGRSSIRNGVNTDLTIENILSYNRTSDEHSLFITGLLLELMKTDRRETVFLPETFQTTSHLGMHHEAANLSTGHNFYETHLISQMIRANYSFDSRYLFTFTTRRDGYSGFGADHKWGLFPSIALGYNIHNEEFFLLKDQVSELKLLFIIWIKRKSSNCSL